MSVSKKSGGKVTCRKVVPCSQYKDAVNRTRYGQNPDGTLGEPLEGSNSIGSAIGQSIPDLNSAAVETLSDFINNGLYDSAGGLEPSGPFSARPLELGECWKPTVVNCPTLTMDFETTANDPESDGLAGFSQGGPYEAMGLNVQWSIATDCY